MACAADCSVPAETQILYGIKGFYICSVRAVLPRLPQPQYRVR